MCLLPGLVGGFGDQDSFGERELLFMSMLKEAYGNDLNLIVSCTYDTQAVARQTVVGANR